MNQAIPLYLVIDTTLAADELEAIELGNGNLCRSFKCDPFFLEFGQISLIAAGANVNRLTPLVDCMNFKTPRLLASIGGGEIDMDSVIHLLSSCIQYDAQRFKRKGQRFLVPIIVLFMFGKLRSPNHNKSSRLKYLPKAISDFSEADIFSCCRGEVYETLVSFGKEFQRNETMKMSQMNSSAIPRLISEIWRDYCEPPDPTWLTAPEEPASPSEINVVL